MKTRQITPAQSIEQSAIKAETLLKELASAPRLMVLCHLVDGEKTVSELQNILDISQSSLSQHLARLREANLVSCTRDGQMIRYRICSIQAQAILSVLHAIYCKP